MTKRLSAADLAVTADRPLHAANDISATVHPALSRLAAVPLSLRARLAPQRQAKTFATLIAAAAR